MTSKPWWRALALAIVARARAGQSCKLRDVADLLESILPDVAEPYAVPRAAFAAAVRACVGRRGGIAVKIPAREKGALARAIWRNLAFALGPDASIGGLMATAFEASPEERDVSEDLATVIGELVGGSRGVAAWASALGLGGAP